MVMKMNYEGLRVSYDRFGREESNSTSRRWILDRRELVVGVERV